MKRLQTTIIAVTLAAAMLSTSAFFAIIGSALGKAWVLKDSTFTIFLPLIPRLLGRKRRLSSRGAGLRPLHDLFIRQGSPLYHRHGPRFGASGVMLFRRRGKLFTSRHLPGREPAARRPLSALLCPRPAPRSGGALFLPPGRCGG